MFYFCFFVKFAITIVTIEFVLNEEENKSVIHINV